MARYNKTKLKNSRIKIKVKEKKSRSSRLRKKRKEVKVRKKPRSRKLGVRKKKRLTIKRESTKRRSKRKRKLLKRRRHIGYVIPGCDLSGGIAVICQHVNRLMERGMDVVLISINSNSRSIDWFPNQRVPILPLSAVKNTHFRVLVATQWSTAYHVEKMSADRKFYFVQSVENRFYPEGTNQHRLALQSYYFNFEYMTEALWIQHWLKENFNHDSIYVPNGIDELIFHPTEPIEPKGDKVRVLLEGPVDNPQKGMADAFAAVKDLECEVWCVSRTGQLQPEWRCDRFFSQLPIMQMKHIYSSCDILLKLSQVEGFFGPPLEMMACGGTAVVGNCTGHDEYIVDGHNALVVPLGDVEAARSAVERLINDPELRQQLSLNGLHTAQEWRWDRTIDALQQAFV